MELFQRTLSVGGGGGVGGVDTHAYTHPIHVYRTIHGRAGLKNRLQCGAEYTLTASPSVDPAGSINFVTNRVHHCVTMGGGGIDPPLHQSLF